MIIVPISAKRQREIFTTKSYTFSLKLDMNFDYLFRSSYMPV